jgi:hypothetical protein
LQHFHATHNEASFAPLHFGRFWALFQLFKKRSKTIEKHLKGVKKQFKRVCLHI